MAKRGARVLEQWPDTALERAGGLNHSELLVDLGPGYETAPGMTSFQVTWDGSAGAIRGQSRKGAFVHTPLSTFIEIPADRKLGFRKLVNRQGQLIDNPYVFGSANWKNNFDEDRTPASPDRLRADPGALHGFNSAIIPTLAPVSVIEPSADDNVFGLDIDLIWIWWNNILNLDPNDPLRAHGYKRFATANEGATNCNGMTCRGLMVGGLDLYAKPPHNIVFQGSKTIQKWAWEASKRIHGLNSARKRIFNDPDYQAVGNIFTTGIPQADFYGVEDLPSLAEWKEKSAVKASLSTGLARRKEQVKRIDWLLVEYHAARDNARIARQLANPVAPAMATPIEQLAPLGNAHWRRYLIYIYQLCFEHLIDKQRSTRRLAVMSLARSIEKILRGHSFYLLMENQRPLREIAGAQTPPVPAAAQPLPVTPTTPLTGSDASRISRLFEDRGLEDSFMQALNEVGRMP